MAVLFVPMAVSGFAHGGGGVTEGQPLPLDEAWAEAQRLATVSPYGDTVAAIRPVLPRTGAPTLP